MADRDDILPDLDEARAEIAAIGLRRYSVTLRARTWTGGDPGIGTAADVDLPLIPAPRTRQLTSAEIANSGGTYEKGDYRVDKITPGYSALDSGLVRHTGTGTGKVTPSTSVPTSGVWVGSWAYVVQVLSPTTFRYSTDGGTTWSGTMSIAPSVSTPGPHALPTGVSLAFSGTFNTGDSYSFTGESGGYTPIQLKQMTASDGQDVVVILTGDDGIPRSCMQVGELAFDRAFGYRFVVRPRRESP